MEEPQTKRALHVLRESYDNTAAFLVDLYHEHLLQQKLQIISLDLKELHHEFLRCQEANKGGQTTMMEWQAQHSFGGYMKTCNNMLGSLMEPMDLNLDKMRGLDPEHDIAKKPSALMKLHWQFLLELVATRAWSQLHLSVLPPFHYTMTFLEDLSDRDEAAKIFKKVAKAITGLEDFVKENPDKQSARTLLTDIGTHHWVLTREFMILGEQCRWNLRDPQFLEQCLAVFACGNSTKYTLESAFNHMKDSIRQAWNWFVF